MHTKAATEGSLPRQWCLRPEQASAIVQYNNNNNNNNTAIGMSYIGLGAFATLVMILFFLEVLSLQKTKLNYKHSKMHPEMKRRTNFLIKSVTIWGTAMHP
jgi:hypothetical protein